MYLFQIYLRNQDGCWKEQQDAEPHQLQDEGHPSGIDIWMILKNHVYPFAGFSYLYWTVQGLRQAHERDLR